MQIINKYPKSCSVCKKPVGVGEGFAANGSGKWQTFCRAHAPEQIVARQAQSTVRALHANGFVDLPYDPSNVGIIKSAPGATWHKQDCNCGCGGCKKWSVSLAHQDRLRVLEIADRLQLQVAPVLRTLCDADHASLADVDLPAGKSLYPFQKEGIAWLSRRDRAVLGDEMGLGKTVQILLALGKEDRVIVVCPNSLKLNWRDEANLWRPEFKVRIVKAEDKKTGGFPIPKKGEIVVVNYDILPSWLDFDPRKPETAALPKGVEVLKGITVVVDEAHFVANYKAKRSRKITNIANLVSRVWFATGTSLTTNPGNLWGILSAAGIAREAFGSWTSFKRLFGARDGKWGGVVWGDESQVDPTVPERLRRVSLRRLRTDVLPQLPKKTYQQISVNDIKPGLKSQLDAIWDEQGEWLEVDGSLPSFEEFSKVKAQLAEAKIPALIEQIEEHEEQGIPLVVFSDHIAPVDACGARPGWGVIKGDTKIEDRRSIVAAFQNGALKGIALTIPAGGTGLTLHRSWKVLFNDINWTPTNNRQAEDRIVRIGQTASAVQVTHLVTNHPLEKHIHGLCVKKEAVAKAAIDSSIAAAAPQASSNGQRVSVQGETAAEYAARQEAARLAAEAEEQKRQQEEAVAKVARAKSKVDGILNSERARNSRVEKPITAQLADEIRAGIRHLSSICDGAQARDGEGFSKSDTYRGKSLALAGLQDEKELRAAWYILLRYPRQWQFSA